ncbi:hypothetical protein MLD38_011581 [Melastoma candidum]|uniref:Uncharacterized protein n=1 Tax=Melastoma candidum TaxID=119954 RepID=A0ACB9R2X7_9MYRT|nr:hypothetical protein MLD38_011581 [Melastoma candidum]
MESILTEKSNDSFEKLKFHHRSVSIPKDRDLSEEFMPEDGFGNPSRETERDLRPGTGSGVSSHSGFESPEENDPSNTILKFIGEILMEEDLDDKNCMLLDCLAKLQAEEKSWYEVLNPTNPPLPTASSVLESRGDFSPEGCSSNSCNSCRAVDDDGFEVNEFVGPGDFGYYVPVGDSPYTSAIEFSSSWGIESSGLLNASSHVYHDKFEGKSELSASSGATSEAITELVNEGRSLYLPGSSTRDKKSHSREEGDVLQEGRGNKQSAVSFIDEAEPTDLFDEVLLCQGGKEKPPGGPGNPVVAPKFQQNGQSKGSTNGKGARRQKKDSKADMVDLWTLLTQCAQSVASNDHRSSNELLKQIRQHSTPYGDGTQRLAHYFANGLEARLAGTETPSYSALLGGVSAAQMLKSHQVYIQACPFKRMSNFFANRMIMRRAGTATKIHIIDFGILYGFQWPCLIKRISGRLGGAPKLRITGIDFPQPGFKPMERVEETGRRLENYSKRFNVEFEYRAIARKWETIQVEDLRLEDDEMTVVNCLYRFKNLADETVVMNSPREGVLKLVRKINPDLFVHGVVNGTYNAPFFLTRFKEALFHFSSLYDMFDVNVDRENQQRMLFEREVYGRDVMNVIACEGFARVERPETYKQWQMRNLRAGFKPIPLDKDIFGRVKDTVRSEYHGDFIIDEDGRWMLQGWKGRVIYALSCWVPA